MALAHTTILVDFCVHSEVNKTHSYTCLLKSVSFMPMKYVVCMSIRKERALKDIES